MTVPQEAGDAARNKAFYDQGHADGVAAERARVTNFLDDLRENILSDIAACAADLIGDDT